jgi:APA family basic amino acid/polyamine antiporter
MSSAYMMGFWSVLGLTIGAQLGTGMFLLPAQLAPYGLWSVLSWALTGSGALILALIFSKLAQHNTQQGGPQVYAYAAFGKTTAFYVGWIYWVISWLSSVPVLIVYAGALEHLFGPFTGSTRFLIEAVSLFALMILNVRGALTAGIGEIFFSTLKVLLLVAIPVYVLMKVPFTLCCIPENISPLKAIHEASLLGFWGYIGLECGTTVTNCVRSPARTIPKALCLGSLIVTLLYFFNTSIILSVVPTEKLLASSSPYSELLTHLFGPMGGRLMSVLIIIMCLGTLNSWILTSGQIAVIAAQNRLFPPFFGKRNQAGSPYVSIILTTLLLLACILLLNNQGIHQQLHLLINLSVSLFIIVYMVCVAAFCVLMFQKKISPHPFSFLLGGLGLTFCAWAISGAGLSLILGALGILAAGALMKLMVRWYDRVC